MFVALELGPGGRCGRGGGQARSLRVALRLHVASALSEFGCYEFSIEPFLAFAVRAAEIVRILWERGFAFSLVPKSFDIFFDGLDFLVDFFALQLEDF